jgi:hypothetical protein
LISFHLINSLRVVKISAEKSPREGNGPTVKKRKGKDVRRTYL